MNVHTVCVGVCVCVCVCVSVCVLAGCCAQRQRDGLYHSIHCVHAAHVLWKKNREVLRAFRVNHCTDICNKAGKLTHSCTLIHAHTHVHTHSFSSTVLFDAVNDWIQCQILSDDPKEISIIDQCEIMFIC